MLTLSILVDLHANPVDFFLAYTQADVKTEIFVELSICFGIEGSHLREWVIRLDKNLYGLKDAGLSLFEILLFYMDYYLMFSPSEDKIDEFYASFQAYINI